MAKDGTSRGGSRVGSGRKPKNKKDANVVALADICCVDLNSSTSDIECDIPEYMTMKQRNGKELGADEIYKKTVMWLRERGCDKMVDPQLIEHYAMSVARWRQCETFINDLGLLAKHPTTGNAIASPYVTMSQQYMKQINQTWYQIYNIVKDKCSDEYGSNGQKDVDVMEMLLRG